MIILFHRDLLANCNASESVGIRKKVFELGVYSLFCFIIIIAAYKLHSNLSMDCQLADFERMHHVKQRWLKSDEEYTDARRAFLTEKQMQLYSCLWATVVKRHYLLRMKAKYAGKAACRNTSS